MVILFLIGLFGIKVGIVVFVVVKFFTWLSATGQAIKQSYEAKIEELQEQVDVFTGRAADCRVVEGEVVSRRISRR